MVKNKIIVIVGPTAVGKTKISIDIAKQFNGEIISGDSMQIYKGMDIGTDKITQGEMANIPHYMIDIIHPNESFSVAQFQHKVRSSIKRICEKGKIPIIVGGSGLYIDAILHDYRFKHKRNEELTHKLEQIYKTEGITPLYEELQRVDKEQAKKIHPNNIRRVIRALEIYKSTGKTMTEIHQMQKQTTIYDYKLIGLEKKREILYNLINQRIDLMIKRGLVEEVRQLVTTYGRDIPSMQAIGYKEIIPYLNGEASLEHCVNRLKKHTRNYAKRQFTWFKNKMNVQWYHLDNQTYQQMLHSIHVNIKHWLYE